MKRREFLAYTSGAAVSASLFRVERAFAVDPVPAGWRMFEVTTRAEVLKPAGATKVWLPAALIQNTPFQRTISNRITADGGEAKIVERNPADLGIVVATFPPEVRPALTLTSQVALKNYSVDLSKPGNGHPASKAELQYFLQPTKHM